MDYSKLINAIDYEKWKKIIRNASKSGFTVNGFVNAEKAAKIQVISTMKQKPKCVEKILTAICEEFNTVDLLDEVPVDLHDIENIITNDNIIGVAAYLASKNSELTRKVIDKIETFDIKKDNQESLIQPQIKHVNEVNTKKEDSFRSKYLKMVTANKKLEEEKLQYEDEIKKHDKTINVLTKEKADLLFQNMKLKTDMEILTQKFDEKLEKIRQSEMENKKTIEEYELKNKRDKCKKVAVIASLGGIELGNEEYEIIMINEQDYLEVIEQVDNYNEIWLITNEVSSQRVKNKLINNEKIKHKLKKFANPIEFKKYLLRR